MMQTKEAKLAELQATLAMQREEYYAKKDQVRALCNQSIELLKYFL